MRNFADPSMYFTTRMHDNQQVQHPSEPKKGDGPCSYEIPSQFLAKERPGSMKTRHIRTHPVPIHACFQNQEVKTVFMETERCSEIKAQKKPSLPVKMYGCKLPVRN